MSGENEEGERSELLINSESNSAQQERENQDASSNEFENEDSAPAGSNTPEPSVSDPPLSIPDKANIANNSEGTDLPNANDGGELDIEESRVDEAAGREPEDAPDAQGNVQTDSAQIEKKDKSHEQSAEAIEEEVNNQRADPESDHPLDIVVPISSNNAKEAVRDPGVIAASVTTENENVIDVDTFDDDSDEEDESSSPATDDEEIESDSPEDSAQPDFASQPDASRGGDAVDLTMDASTSPRESTPGGDESAGEDDEHAAALDAEAGEEPSSMMQLDELGGEAEIRTDIEQPPPVHFPGHGNIVDNDENGNNDMALTSVTEITHVSRGQEKANAGLDQAASASAERSGAVDKQEAEARGDDAGIMVSLGGDIQNERRDISHGLDEESNLDKGRTHDVDSAAQMSSVESPDKDIDMANRSSVDDLDAVVNDDDEITDEAASGDEGDAADEIDSADDDTTERRQITGIDDSIDIDDASDDDDDVAVADEMADDRPDVPIAEIVSDAGKTVGETGLRGSFEVQRKAVESGTNKDISENKDLGNAKEESGDEKMDADADEITDSVKRTTEAVEVELTSPKVLQRGRSIFGSDSKANVEDAGEINRTESESQKFFVASLVSDSSATGNFGKASAGASANPVSPMSGPQSRETPEIGTIFEPEKGEEKKEITPAKGPNHDLRGKERTKSPSSEFPSESVAGTLTELPAKLAQQTPNAEGLEPSGELKSGADGNEKNLTDPSSETLQSPARAVLSSNKERLTTTSIPTPSNTSAADESAAESIDGPAKVDDQKAGAEEHQKPAENEEDPSEHISRNPTRNLPVSRSAPSEVHESPESKTTPGGDSHSPSAHLAPMFGMQMSKPVKSGPISFSSPPSFPRYSLNPNAAPFTPEKLGNDGQEESISERESGPQDTEISGSERVQGIEPAAKISAPDSLQLSSPESKKNATLGKKKAVHFAERLVTLAQGPPALPKETSTSSQSEKEGRGGGVEGEKHSSTEIEKPQEAENVSSASTVSEPLLRPALRPPSKAKSFTFSKPVQKKVSFAVTPETRKKESPKDSDRPQLGLLKPSTSLKAASIVENDPANVSLGAERLREPSIIKTAAPHEAVADTKLSTSKQKVIQVQTDEGLRKEVNNVKIATRQGNGRVSRHETPFVVRLTIRKEGGGKLEFLRGSGPSMRLWASLDSASDNLRVRKITNKQHVMSVAKIASAGDDASEIASKYFLHFENESFDGMFSSCVEHLQSLPQTGTSAPKVATKTLTEKAPSVVEQKRTSDLPAGESSGTKRPAEKAQEVQANKRSKLLADKKKLLDKMAALRKKKEQTGSPSPKRERVEGTSANSNKASKKIDGPQGASSLGTASPPRRFVGSKSPRNEELNTPDSTHRESDRAANSAPFTKEFSISKDVPQPKKRAAEQLDDVNASKRPRMPKTSAPEQLAWDVPLSTLSDGAKIPKQSLTDPKVQESTKPSDSPGTPSLSHGIVTGAREETRAIGGTISVVNPPDATAALAKSRSDDKEKEGIAATAAELRKSRAEKEQLNVALQVEKLARQEETMKHESLRQKHSESWKQILHAVEGVERYTGYLRREETDRALPSLEKCQATNSSDFFDRLHSFRPSTWPAFESGTIGAIECALRGWHNWAPSRLRSSEGAEICLGEEYEDATLRLAEEGRVSSLLREGHCLLSGWVGQPCPESFKSLEGSGRSVTTEQLRVNVEKLGDIIRDTEVSFAWGDNGLLMSNRVNERLAAYNWSTENDHLRCTWCNRRVTVESGSRFDAREKHYSFCPFRGADWKKCVLRNATFLGIQRDSDSMMNDVGPATQAGV